MYHNLIYHAPSVSQFEALKASDQGRIQTCEPDGAFQGRGPGAE